MSRADARRSQYFAAYMTSASPAADSEDAGTGETWFKIWEALPTFVPSNASSPGSLDFPYEGECVHGRC